VLRTEGSPPLLRLSERYEKASMADMPDQLSLPQAIFHERSEVRESVPVTLYQLSGRNTLPVVAEASPDSFWRSNGRGGVDTPASLEKLRLGKVFGQLKGSYILMEVDDGLMVIDQHAAHERIIYEEILHSLSNGSSPSQALLIPLLIHFDGRESAVLEEYLPLLSKVGFGINELGNNSFSIDARPSFLKTEEVSETLRDFAQSAGEGKAKGPLVETHEKIARMIACKSRSIKAKEELTYEEIKELIQRLTRAKQPFTCPHGRPTLIKLTTRELEAKFLRT